MTTWKHHWRELLFPWPRCPALPSPEAHTDGALGPCGTQSFSQEAYGFHHRHPQNSDYGSPHSSHSSPTLTLWSPIFILLHGPFLSVPSHGSVSSIWTPRWQRSSPLSRHLQSMGSKSHHDWATKLNWQHFVHPGWDSASTMLADFGHVTAGGGTVSIHTPHSQVPATCHSSLSFWEGGQNQTPQFLCF